MTFMLQDNMNKHIPETDFSKTKKLFVPVLRRYNPETRKSVVYYVPNPRLVNKVCIEAIDLETGQIVKDEILYLTKHENVNMYQMTIKDKYIHIVRNIPIFSAYTTNEFEKQIYITDDHSLIVYDASADRLVYMPFYKAIEPTMYFVQKLDTHVDTKTVYETLITALRKIDKDKKGHVYLSIEQLDQKPLAKKLINQNCLLVPVNLFDFIYSPNIKEAYDFTTVRTKTFSCANGLFVMDTIVVYSLHTEEAKKEAWEKMRFSRQLHAISNAESTIADLSKNIAQGWYYATLDPKQLGKKQKHLNKGKVYKTLEELREDFRKAGPEYTVHDIVTIEDTDGNLCDTEIGKAFLILAVKKVLME